MVNYVKRSKNVKKSKGIPFKKNQKASYKNRSNYRYKNNKQPVKSLKQSLNPLGMRSPYFSLSPMDKCRANLANNQRVVNDETTQELYEECLLQMSQPQEEVTI